MFFFIPLTKGMDYCVECFTKKRPGGYNRCQFHLNNIRCIFCRTPMTEDNKFCMKCYFTKRGVVCKLCFKHPCDCNKYFSYCSKCGDLLKTNTKGLFCGC